MAFVAKENLFLNEDKTKVLKEGDPDARFTLTVKGAAVDEENIEKYKLKGSVEDLKSPAVTENSIVISGAPEGKQFVVSGKEVEVSSTAEENDKKASKR